MSTIVLMNSFVFYFNIMNLSDVLDCHLDFIVFLFKLPGVTVSYILIVTSLKLLACGMLLRLLGFLSTTIIKYLYGTPMVFSYFDSIFYYSFLLSIISSFYFTFRNSLSIRGFIAFFVKKIFSH